ncbi:MAG: UDP-N-acetylglucosamine 4,6-dehydratase, partial [Bacteroidota bacterium]
GEKDFEEFYTDKEILDLKRFKNLGIIKNERSFENDKLEHFNSTIRKLKEAKGWNKAELVSLFQELIPNFLHKETGKYLDSKM